MDFDWNLFKTFFAIAQYGGVGAAARALHREQPSVSAALKRLEQHFGTHLCERTSRGIALTPAGHALYEACVSLRETIHRLPAEMSKVDSEIEATLTVLMISDVVAPAFNQGIRAFHQAYPKVEIRIDIAPWRAVIDALRREEVMLGIACDSMPSPDFSYRPLIREVQQLYCGAGHPLFGSGPVDPARLADETFVLTGEDEPDELTRFRRAWGFGRRSGGAAATLFETSRLVRMGFGIGFLPVAVAESVAPAGTLWPLLDPGLLPDYPLHLIRKRETKQTPLENRLLDAFLDACASQAHNAKP